MGYKRTDLESFKLNTVGLDKTRFGNIYTFVDFGNVNYWYRYDRYDQEGKLMDVSAYLIIDIQELAGFISGFSEKKFFYYGFDQSRKKSWHIHKKAEICGFVKVTKPIQYIRHYPDEDELGKIDDIHLLSEDAGGKYIKIPKSNFDVEISVDAIRLLDYYDTFCLFSGDSDFAYLARYLKRRRKKIIIVASGKIFHTLKEQADLYINAQSVKSQITAQKIKNQKPRF